MSDTPRTDDFARSMSELYDSLRECGWPEFDICDITEFARGLERENAALRAAISEAGLTLVNRSAGVAEKEEEES